jgi:hypothetical protein
MRWACGITTVPGRRNTYLPLTLAGIERTGFPKPRLFVDGGHPDAFQYGTLKDCEVTARDPIGAFGNFALGLWELVMRNPDCDRFAMFQDDVAFCRDVREYLDGCRYPEKGYWNLFTYARSERVVIGKTGWVEGGLVQHEDLQPDPERLQKGQGALALVFSREAALTMLEQPPFVRKPISANRPRTCVDGAIVGAMNHAGWREWVHAPSLVQHIGIESTVQVGKKWSTFSDSFRGEDWSPLKPS